MENLASILSNVSENLDLHIVTLDGKDITRDVSDVDTLLFRIRRSRDGFALIGNRSTGLGTLIVDEKGRVTSSSRSVLV